MGFKRRRRSADEARAAILDAAEVQLRARGPEGIRLQELAGELGVSHPAILHHFGSREGLVTAVVDRALRRLESDILAALAGDVDQRVASELMAEVFRVMQDEGHARVLAWLALSPNRDPDPALTDGEPKLEMIARAVHRHRCQAGDRAVEPRYDDTVFTVLLAASAVLGSSIAGDTLRASAGLAGDPTASARFHGWLTRVLLTHLDGPGIDTAGSG